MPELRHIQVPGDTLAALVNGYGIIGPGPAWWLSDIIQPVSIVSSQVQLTAEAAPVLFTVTQSAGERANEGANFRHVNTGQLDAGDYFFRVMTSAEADESWRIRVRDAADAADIWSMLVVGRYTQQTFFEITWSLAQNERLVVENTSAVVGVSQARVWYARI